MQLPYLLQHFLRRIRFGQKPNKFRGSQRPWIQTARTATAEDDRQFRHLLTHLPADLTTIAIRQPAIRMDKCDGLPMPLEFFQRRPPVLAPDDLQSGLAQQKGEKTRNRLIVLDDQSRIPRPPGRIRQDRCRAKGGLSMIQHREWHSRQGRHRNISHDL